MLGANPVNSKHKCIKYSENDTKEMKGIGFQYFTIYSRGRHKRMYEK
jgi:hypothetical protein